MRGQRMLVAVTLVAGLVTGCSSSGGGGSSAPTTAQLTAKLKNDPQIKQLESRAGSKAGRVKQVIGCIASALAKDADPNDLKRYVAGKLDLADIGGKAAGSAKRAQADTRNCAVQKLSG